MKMKKKRSEQNQKLTQVENEKFFNFNRKLNFDK